MEASTVFTNHVMEKSWKDHPLAIAAGSAIAAATFTALIFNQIAIPTQTAGFRNQVDEQQRGVESLKQQLSQSNQKAAASQKQTEELRTELQAARLKLEEAQQTNLFGPGS